jgi:FK506-binding protein 4/5
LKKLRLSLYLNIAAAEIHLEHLESALTWCNKALDLDFENVKARYRRASVHLKLKNFSQAKADLLRGFFLLSFSLFFLL